MSLALRDLKGKALGAPVDEVLSVSKQFAAPNDAHKLPQCGGKSAEAIVVNNEPGVGRPAQTMKPEDSMARRAEPMENPQPLGGHPSQYHPTGRGKGESRHTGNTWSVRGEAAGIKIEVAASEKEQDGNIRFRI